jgi:hypothetical protein
LLERRELEDSGEREKSPVIEEETNGRMTIEVGQTLFEPKYHPGFLNGKSMVVGQLVQYCGGTVSSSSFFFF